MNVPLLDVKAQIESCREDISRVIDKVFDECRFIMGEEVAELERRIAEYTGAKFAVACASGTDALLLSLRAIGIEAGDEVITTPFTFFATAGVISNVGAKPVFADIDEQTFNIDPDKINPNSKTKAVIAVHLYGQCADMERVSQKAQGVKIIEDAAQSIGAKHKNKMSGIMGALGCFSFFPSKNLGGVGDGGMITTNDHELFEKTKILRLHGEKKKYFHSIVGTNSRLDTIQAAVLLVKLLRLDLWAEQRREHGSYYNEAFSGIKQIKVPYIDPNCYHVFNQYTIRVKNRDALQSYLMKKGIGSAIYYPLPLHLQECFSSLGYKKGDFPVAERVSAEVLSLPVYPELPKEKQDYVIKNIKEFYR